MILVSCSSLLTNDEYHQININGTSYILRASVGGIGGSFLYTIGKKKRSGWKFDEKNELVLHTNDLTPCYYDEIDDTLHFYSENQFTIPNSMSDFPIIHHPLSDTVNAEYLYLVHSYSNRGYEEEYSEDEETY